jgi:hypothetical protein
MSYYYKYQFVSPEPLFATVKEELKSYFDTGAVDDLLFPTYLDKCLRKLGKATYSIKEQLIDINDFQARLPDNFYAVREAWLCAEIDGYPYQSANSFYSQAASETTIQVSPVVSGGSPCTNVDCVNPNCNGAECMPILIQGVYKTNNEINVSYKKQYLLKPGNISVKGNCTLDCANFGSSAADSFDIRDNKFVTNFRNGTVYLVFYAMDYDEFSGLQLVPDNYRIREYIEAFLKYKVFETLVNQVMDETFNQLQQKLVYFKQLADEAYIMAEMEIKKQDVNAKFRRLKQSMNRHQKYELPGTNVHNWRRNGGDR